MASKEFMCDYTPPVLALQGVLAMRELFCLQPESILDPSAGSGIFGQAFRVVWPDAATWAVEPKGIESWYLSRNYLNHDICSFEEFHSEFLHYPEVFDLVMSNPPFHSWEVFIRMSLLLVKPGGYVCFLGLTAWGSRSESGYDFFHKYPPVAQMRIPGAVSYRSKGNDTRDYCYWVFRRAEGDIPAWASFNLPRLPGHLRRWHLGHKPGRCSHGKKLQEDSAQHLLSSFRERCVPRGVFV